MNVRLMERVALGASVALCLLTGSLSQGQFGPPTHEPKGPWENESLSPDERADLVIEKMTLDEKVQLLHGLGCEVLFGPTPETGVGSCDRVIVRPMSFTNRGKTGNVSVVTDMSLTVRLRLRITRSDVAAFLVKQVVENDYVGQMPVIFT